MGRIDSSAGGDVVTVVVLEVRFVVVMMAGIVVAVTVVDAFVDVVGFCKGNANAAECNLSFDFFEVIDENLFVSVAVL